MQARHSPRRVKGMVIGKCIQLSLEDRIIIIIMSVFNYYIKDRLMSDRLMYLLRHKCTGPAETQVHGTCWDTDALDQLRHRCTGTPGAPDLLRHRCAGPYTGERDLLRHRCTGKAETQAHGTRRDAGAQDLLWARASHQLLINFQRPC